MVSSFLLPALLLFTIAVEGGVIVVDDPRDSSECDCNYVGQCCLREALGIAKGGDVIQLKVDPVMESVMTELRKDDSQVSGVICLMPHPLHPGRPRIGPSKPGIRFIEFQVPWGGAMGTGVFLGFAFDSILVEGFENVYGNVAAGVTLITEGGTLTTSHSPPFPILNLTDCEFASHIGSNNYAFALGGTIAVACQTPNGGSGSCFVNSTRCDVWVERTVFRNNTLNITLPSYGGGTFGASGNHNVTFLDTLFENNNLTYATPNTYNYPGGSAISTYSCSRGDAVLPVTIKGCTFRGNSGGARGAVVQVHYSYLTINSTVFVENKGQSGGFIKKAGVYPSVIFADEIDMAGVVIENADTNLAAFFAEGGRTGPGKARLEFCTLTNDDASPIALLSYTVTNQNPNTLDLTNHTAFGGTDTHWTACPGECNVNQRTCSNLRSPEGEIVGYSCL